MAGTVSKLESLGIIAAFIALGLIVLSGISAFNGIKLPGFPDIGSWFSGILNGLGGFNWSSQADGNNNEYADSYNPTFGDQAGDAAHYVEETIGNATDPASLLMGDDGENDALAAVINSDSVTAVRSDPGAWLQNNGIF
jgi:hypothetical protein